jgi:hypothetical protein
LILLTPAADLAAPGRRGLLAAPALQAPQLLLAEQDHQITVLELQAVEVDHRHLLTDTEEAADLGRDRGRLAIGVDQHLLDLADLRAGRVHEVGILQVLDRQVERRDHQVVVRGLAQGNVTSGCVGGSGKGQEGCSKGRQEGHDGHDPSPRSKAGPVDRGGTGAFLVTDIGQRHVEEVNLGIKGANYGWPLREGTFATDRRDPTVLRALPPDDAALGFTYPVAQYDRDEANGGKMAITGGFVYRGAAIPALAGEYLFGDIVSGRVFHVPVRDLRPGAQATIKELTLLENGKPITLQELVGRRVDLRFGQDEAGEVYLLTKQDGAIRKLVAT